MRVPVRVRVDDHTRTDLGPSDWEAVKMITVIGSRTGPLCSTTVQYYCSCPQPAVSLTQTLLLFRSVSRKLAENLSVSCLSPVCLLSVSSSCHFISFNAKEPVSPPSPHPRLSPPLSNTLPYDVLPPTVYCTSNPSQPYLHPLQPFRRPRLHNLLLLPFLPNPQLRPCLKLP